MPTARNERWWHYALTCCVMTAFMVAGRAIWHGVPANWDGWLENVERGLLFAIPFTLFQVVLDRFRGRSSRA